MSSGTLHGATVRETSAKQHVYTHNFHMRNVFLSLNFETGTVKGVMQTSLSWPFHIQCASRGFATTLTYTHIRTQVQKQTLIHHVPPQLSYFGHFPPLLNNFLPLLMEAHVLVVWPHAMIAPLCVSAAMLRSCRIQKTKMKRENFDGELLDPNTRSRAKPAL